MLKRRAQAQRASDLTTGGRVFNTCWLSASLGISTLQMLLSAQGWREDQQAWVPAMLMSAWMLGSLVATRCGGPARLWGAGLLTCALAWSGGRALIVWRIPHPLGLPPLLVDHGVLALLAFLLGASSTVWLAAPRAWPAVGEKTALVRDLVGLTVGLLLAWSLSSAAGLLALACCLPLLVLDVFLSGRAPLPAPNGTAARWMDRHWRAEGWPVQLEQRGLLQWWQGCSREGVLQPVRGTLLLTWLASAVAVVAGSVWGGVPTPFAASLEAIHHLDVLSWLLGGQLVALAAGCALLGAARGVIGFSRRWLSDCWLLRGRRLSLLLPLVMAVCLAALGTPVLQARWWLALSLAIYTLAAAVWAMLLPRLVPDLSTLVQARRHLLGQEQGARLADPFHLAHVRAREARTRLLRAQAQRVTIVACTPLLGWLVVRLGSADAVLVMVGLAFAALGILCAALVWMPVTLEHGPVRVRLRSNGTTCVFPVARFPSWRRLPLVARKG